jgi:hypothetical protein
MVMRVMDGHPHDSTDLLCVCHLKQKSGRDVVRRVKVNSSGLGHLREGGEADECAVLVQSMYPW